jgi:hypothetical protein
MSTSTRPTASPAGSKTPRSRASSSCASEASRHRPLPLRLRLRRPTGLGSQTCRGRRRLGYATRGRDRLRAAHAMFAAKQTENLPVWTGCTWRKQSHPAVHRDLLSDALVSTPCAATRERRFEPDLRESLSGGEVGDLHVYLPRPQLARHLRERRDHALREMPVPLCPSGRLAVGQIERVNNISALPAVVRRRVALW